MDIHSYASHGDCSGVRGEPAKGVPVDAKNEQDYTPLACALKSDKPDEEVLTVLISSGADVNAAVDHSEKSPIGIVACSGNIEVVQMFLEADANIQFQSPKGYTVLIDIMYALHDNDSEEQHVENTDQFCLNLLEMSWAQLRDL